MFYYKKYLKYKEKYLQLKNQNGGSNITFHNHKPMDIVKYRKIYVFNESYRDYKNETKTTLLQLPERANDIILFEDLSTSKPYNTRLGPRDTIPISEPVEEIIKLLRVFTLFSLIQKDELTIQKILFCIRTFLNDHSNVTRDELLANQQMFFNLFKVKMSETLRLLSPVLNTILEKINYNNLNETIESFQNNFQKLVNNEIIDNVLRENEKTNENIPFFIITNMSIPLLNVFIEELSRNQPNIIVLT